MNDQRQKEIEAIVEEANAKLMVLVKERAEKRAEALAQAEAKK